MTSGVVLTIAESGWTSSIGDSHEGTGPVFGMLMVIALIIKLIWWILGAVVLYVLFRVGRSRLRAAQASRQAQVRRVAQIAARAEQQQRWVLRGDDRGTYGDYPPADLFSKRR